MRRKDWLDRPGPRPALLDRERPYIMAHRGASDHAPENTAASFRLALDAGADVIETDLWKTTDGHIVCHHDPVAARMCGDVRRIDRMTLAEVRALTVGGPLASGFPVQRVPTLDELLDLVPPDVALTLELKDMVFTQPEHASLLLDSLAPRVDALSVVFASFEMDHLTALKSVRPDVPVALITLRYPLPTLPVEMLGPAYPILQWNPIYVWWAHRRGQWVVPLDPALHGRLRRYLRMGVDAVLTNDPAATRARVDELRSNA